MTSQLNDLQKAIDGTLSAIKDGREQIEFIADSTQTEISRLEQECEELQKMCVEAIEQVESLERDEKRARENLLIVHRDVKKYSESDMQREYESARKVQAELSQWREREHQYRIRRDDALRRLKMLRATAQRAEVLSLKFDHMTGYLSADFEQFSVILNDAQIQTLIGVQILQLLENERETLARELHDGAMQVLASTSMRLQVRTAGNEELKSLREDFRGQLNQVIGELRKTIFELRPPLLDDLGIVPALKRYTTQWTEYTGIPVHSQLIGLEFSLTPTEKITVFRCVQEALANVVTHSRATRVDMTTLFKETSVQFTIEDNGIGIADIQWLDWLEEGKAGLNLCRQRLQMLGAEIQIMSRTPTGTRIEIHVPTVRGEA